MKIEKEDLVKIVLKYHELFDSLAVDAWSSPTVQLFEGKWISPSLGCDTLQNIIDDIYALCKYRENQKLDNA